MFAKLLDFDRDNRVSAKDLHKCIANLANDSFFNTAGRDFGERERDSYFVGEW